MSAGAFVQYATIALSLVSSASSLTLDTTDKTSIKNAASTVAYDLMKYYTGNVTNTPSTIAVLPSPYYWWEAGAMWGTMVDYYHFTGDSSYNDVTIQALASQVGPNYDYMVPNHQKDEGNDDQAFWGFATMSAAEKGFPEPTNTGGFTWVQLTENMWNTIAARWDTTSCNGGLKWQIFTFNNGYDYKNAVSNGALFQLSARLARFTGNQTYIEWAEKIYDWTSEIGLIDSNFAVYDGTDDTKNCSEVNHITWSYNNAIFLYGSAVMYNYTTTSTWKSRTEGFLSASANFFSPFSNTTNVMYEQACEKVNTCNNDQFSFKAYLSRFMWASTLMAPFTQEKISTYLTTSALAAAKACSGDSDACGTRWWVGGYDGTTGVGQQMSALETIQGLLTGDASALIGKGQAPSSSATSVVSSTSTSVSSSVPKSTTTSSVATTAVVKSSAASSAVSSVVSAHTGVSSAVSSKTTSATAVFAETTAGASGSEVVVTDTIYTSTTVPCTTSSSSKSVISASAGMPYPLSANATTTVRTLLTTTVPCSNSSSIIAPSSSAIASSHAVTVPVSLTKTTATTAVSSASSAGILVDTSATPQVATGTGSATASSTLAQFANAGENLRVGAAGVLVVCAALLVV
ncbi:glycoside hydrolase family 76 protein [Rutstroemia sp. NJR-2017a WRK4]|nr:glycoside hydrolase family 76 protein [Rutstroemia sp. NJR-2017a WRK4]